MADVTVTHGTNDRTGREYWAVTWGPGLTQTAICLNKAEADAVAADPARCQSVAGDCPGCGFAYSFVFGTQFHGGDCPVA